MDHTVTELTPEDTIHGLVSKILCYEDGKEGQSVKLPFYADGFPG